MSPPTQQQIQFVKQFLKDFADVLEQWFYDRPYPKTPNPRSQYPDNMRRGVDAERRELVQSLRMGIVPEQMVQFRRGSLEFEILDKVFSNNELYSHISTQHYDTLTVTNSAANFRNKTTEEQYLSCIRIDGIPEICSHNGCGVQGHPLQVWECMPQSN